jgi:hypothetical protein
MRRRNRRRESFSRERWAEDGERWAEDGGTQKFCTAAVSNFLKGQESTEISCYISGNPPYGGSAVLRVRDTERVHEEGGVIRMACILEWAIGMFDGFILVICEDEK